MWVLPIGFPLSHITFVFSKCWRSSKIDICSPEGIKPDLSKVLGEMRNTMASYLFCTFYLELQLGNTSMKWFHCITQLKSVYAKLFLLISEFMTPTWTETGDFFLPSSNLERVLVKFCPSKTLEMLFFLGYSKQGGKTWLAP